MEEVGAAGAEVDPQSLRSAKLSSLRVDPGERGKYWYIVLGGGAE
jgi:hypothetical protein